MFKKSTVPLGVLTLLGSFLLLGLLGAFLDCLFPVTAEPYLDIKYLGDGSAIYEEYDQNSSGYSIYDRQGHFIEKRTAREVAPVGQVRTSYMHLSYRRDYMRCGPGSAVFSIGQGQRGEYWYILPDEGLMEGYSRETRRLIGYMTPEGLVSEKPAARSRFADIKTWVDMDGLVWLLNGRDLFAMDTSLHTVRKQAVLPEDTLCICEGRVKREADATATYQVQFIFVIAGKRLLKLTTNGEILWAVPLPKELVFEGQDEMTTYREVGIIDNGGTILAAVCYRGKSRQNHIVVLDAKGNLVKSYSLPLSPPWRKEPKENAMRRWLEIAGLESALGPWVMLAGFCATRSVGLGLCVSLLYAVLCAWFIGFDGRGRRLSRRARIFWIVFGFICSLPGLAVYFVVGPRAPMTACPSCGGKRPVDVAECPRCKAAFPKPAPTGLEIFDNA